MKLFDHDLLVPSNNAYSNTRSSVTLNVVVLRSFTFTVYLRPDSLREFSSSTVFPTEHSKMAGLLFVLLALGSLAVGTHAEQPAGCSAAGALCAGLPTECVATNTCDVLAIVSPTPTGVHVNLTGKALGALKLSLASRWIAVGFSETGGMLNSPVVHCLEQGGKAIAELTYNHPIEHFNTGPAKIDQSQIKVGKTSVDGATLSCEADINKKITIDDKVFDLGTQKHSLIVASGPHKDGTIMAHDVDPDSSAPLMATF